MKPWRALSITWLAAACSPAAVLNALTPQQGIKVTQLRYEAGDRHTMEVYRPKRPGTYPVLVFFYGGNWRSGRKSIYKFVGATLARAGVVVAVPDYRLYPEVHFPVFLDDSARAVAYVQAHPAAFGGGPLFLMGHSAGAYNAVMLALDPHYLRAAGSDPGALAGVIGLAGPYDFLPITGNTRPVFGAAADSPETQPIHFARAGAPPLLLLAGNGDRTVKPRNTRALAAAVRAAGGEATARLYPGLGHVGLILAIAPLFQWRAPVLRDVLGFIATHEAPATPATPDTHRNGWPDAAARAKPPERQGTLP